MRVPRAVVDWRTVRAAMLDVMNILPELSQSCRPTDDEEKYSTKSVRVAPDLLSWVYLNFSHPLAHHGWCRLKFRTVADYVGDYFTLKELN